MRKVSTTSNYRTAPCLINFLARNFRCYSQVKFLLLGGKKKTFLRFIGVLQVSLGRTNFWPIFDNNAASVFDRSRTIEFLSEVETMRRGMKETARSLQRGFATRMNSLVCRGSMKELRGVIIRPSKSIW